jgi:hypothetical protein
MNADAKRFHIPELALSGTSSAITFHFRVADPKKHMGWALCTVNETTGELAVCSDWGNWSYRWWPGALPMSSYSFCQREREGLLEFIGERGPQIFEGREGRRDYSMDYIADKLCAEGRSHGRDDSRAFDAWETCKKFKRMLCEKRLEYERGEIVVRGGRDPLSAVLARELWEALSGELADTTDATLFCERFMHLDGWDWITTEPWEHTVYEPTTSFLVLRDAILPALRDAAMEVVRARRPKPPPLGWASDLADAEAQRARAEIGPCPICEFGAPVSCKREPVYWTVGNARCWATRWTSRWDCGHWIVHR